MGETEIIQELDETPVGKFGVRKRLTKTVNDDGTITYSVRTYAPRPLPLDPSKPFDPDTKYVPARGIDLTEDELKSSCKSLRVALYDTRHTPEINLEDLLNDLEDCEPVDLSDFDDNDSEEDEEEYDYDDNDENEDPIPGQDYINELRVELFMPIISFKKDDNTFKELNLLSWHDNPMVYDFREYTKKVNTRGYEELVPELDKGIELNDIEAEMFCRGVESLFPDVAEDNADMREDDYEDTANIFRFPLTDSERTCAVKALDAVMRERLDDRLSQNKYGSQIGEREEDRLFGYLCKLRRKIKSGEFLFDTEARMCAYVFYTAADWTDDYTEKCMLEDIAGRLCDIIEKRNKLPSVKTEQRWLKRLTATAGEFGSISDILHLIYMEIYESDNCEQNKDLQDSIDHIVIYDMETRCSRYLPKDKSYRENAGKNFIKNLIKVFDDVANSPFVEPF